MKFRRVHLEITNICNLKCQFCPEVLRPQKVMSVDEFQFLLKRVEPHAELLCLHLMGEPLAHPQFDKILEVVESSSLKIHLVTNGILLEKWKEQLLNSKAIHQINYSVQSFIDNYPHKDPSAYLQKLTQISDQFHKDVYVNYRFWNIGAEDNKELLAPLFNHYQVPSFEDINPKAQKSFHLKGKHYLHFDTRFEWPSLEAPFQNDKGFCYALRNHLGVLGDGTVVPCCLDKEGQLSLGNLFEKELAQIISSCSAQRLLKGFDNGLRLEKLCQHCDFANRFTPKTRKRAQQTQPIL